MHVSSGIQTGKKTLTWSAVSSTMHGNSDWQHFLYKAVDALIKRTVMRGIVIASHAYSSDFRLTTPIIHLHQIKE